MSADLLALREAQDRLLALARPAERIEIAVEQALGHYLATELIARRTQPARPLSAMDGWAVRAEDLPGPWHIVGESAAGHRFAGQLGPGEAVRISTGAVVPDGADMVIVQEQCTIADNSLSFSGEPPQPLGRHIRAVGMDFREGSRILRQGDKVTPGSLALAIGAGHASLQVHRAPHVAILDTGDELAAIGTAPADGRIPASNGPMLSALLAALPCRVERLGPVPDRIEAIAGALDAARYADLIVTTGGASVGDHDLVRPALEAVGAEVAFWRVALKPGKPIMVATRGAQVILGLPGNPVSAFVTAHLFALPFVRALLGASSPLPKSLRLTCASPLPATGKRAEFVRARIVDGAVEVLPIQDSGALHSAAQAEALICRAPFADAAPPGSIVEALLL